MIEETLRKGANVSLLHRPARDGGRLQAVVRWSDPEGAGDVVDVSALLIGSDGRVRSDEDFVFYNAPTGGDGSVRLLGKRAEEDRGEDRVFIDLETLPDDIERVVIAASLDADSGRGFGDLGELGLVLLDTAGQPTVRFDVPDAGNETAMLLGELYLRGDEWKFRAVGQGWESGLAGLVTDFGITVGDAVENEGILNSDDLVTSPAPPPELTSVTSQPGPTSESMDSLRPPEAHITSNTSAASPVRKPRGGVQTRKKRTTAAALPPLTLAVDPSWQPARLFSISGVGTGADQEKRATSSLMASMMAIREFGRALVSRFGGPAGIIETYLEVPFTLDEHTVIPDAVIRVERAGKIWTALLEVKTGTSSLRVDQVDHYVDLARQQGYDAVITLSNDLTPAGGAHPVEIDSRKLRKVALHHISWSEVLHEAEMQLAHRGVEDRLQAWLLAELIRYLRHPRSGAAGFDDMGPAWVPVREAVAAGTLRATDRKIGSVVASWEKLVRHLCLRLTTQLGATVTQALPRKFALDYQARVEAAVAALAADGTLRTTLRIPGAIGVVEVVADLRTAQVKTSIKVDSPQDGAGMRRVNWMLRQLGDAPDALTVEVIFARREQTSCELLKDLRSGGAPLLPDPGAEVRAFRLSLNAPLGTKRGGLRGAFIPSVTVAVDSFYAEIVQGLKPSAAPRLPPEVAEDAKVAVDHRE